jgi:Spy/CpxP family protein refolding chaperone
MAHAQQTPTPAQQSPAPHADRMYNHLRRKLGLTDDQVTQIRAVNQAQRDAQRQLWQTLRQAQKDLRQLALNGGDASALAAKKAQVDQLLAQGVDMRVQTMQQIGPILTPEQRQKLADMGPAWGGHHRGHKAPKTQS